MKMGGKTTTYDATNIYLTQHQWRNKQNNPDAALIFVIISVKSHQNVQLPTCGINIWAMLLRIL